MDEVFLTLVNRSLAATWLVAAVLVLRFLLRKAPKWTRVGLWALVAVRLICSLSIPSPLSAFNMVDTPVGEDGAVEYLRSGMAQDREPFLVLRESEPVDYDSLALSGPRDDALAGETVTLAQTAPLRPLTFIWLAGMAGMMVYAIICYVNLRRRTAVNLPLGEGVYACDGIDTPFILGVLRPRICLPSALEEPQRGFVLAHERAHLARRDHWWKPLGYALLAVYWFNPALWLAYILLCRDIELACDERVFRDMGLAERADYSQALLEQSRPGRAIAACPVAFGEVGVRERVKAALNYKKPAFWIVALAVIACAIAAVCFLTNPKAKEDKTDGPGTTAETEDTDIVFSSKLSETVRSSWARWDSMDEMTQALQSTSPGYCTRNLSAWAEGEDYVGTALWNPLEDAPWLVWRNFTGSDTLDPFDNIMYHAHLTWTGERDGAVTYIGLTAGYTDGDVRVTITAEPLNRWAEPDWKGAEEFALADGNRVSLKRDSGERYDALDLYTYKNNAHYTVRLISDKGAEAMDAPLERVLGAFGLRRLTLDDVRTLSRKGETLTSQDFDGYEYFETGSGLYIKVYPINDRLSVWLGFADPEGEPVYFNLRAKMSDVSDYDTIDLRTGDVETFLAAHAEPTYRTEGTVFTYRGTEYDLTEQAPAINAITQVRRAGQYYVIEGHVNPNNSVYCVFDTQTERFAKTLTGANLTWQGDDLTTAVYSFWNEILDYEGNTIAVCDLAEGEYIYSLGFDDDGTVLAAIMGMDGTLREERCSRSDAPVAQAETPPAVYAAAPVEEPAVELPTGPVEAPSAEPTIAEPAEEPENSMVVVIDLSDYEGGEEP